MLPLLFALALHAAPAAAAPAPSATPAVEPKIGDAAPAIELPNPQGGNFSLAALAGKTVVVVFYPKAFTGG